MKVLLKENLVRKVHEKEYLFRELLQHPKIKALRSRGLLMAIELEDSATVLKVTQACLKQGVLTDWFLFAPNCIRWRHRLQYLRKKSEKHVQ
jgi:acetylornithine/succinyldiaminopimelate/putrescine aminotransferase